MNLKRKIKKASLLILSAAVFCLSEGISKAEQFDTPPVNSYFYIKSVLSGDANRGYWDQPGQAIRYKKGSNIAAWATDRGIDQQFRFVNAGGGWYNIVSRNGGYADVKGGKNGNGVSIQVWEPNRTVSQKFRFRHLGNGKWKIYTAWNRALCLDGRRDTNGTSIHTWDDHNGPWMEWYFIDYGTGKKYEIADELSGKLKGYDFDGNGVKKYVVPNGAEVEVWYADRSDPKNMYKKMKTIRTDSNGGFKLDEMMKKESSLFLISRSEDRASAHTIIYPKSGKLNFDGFISDKYDADNYILVDTMYRGKQYYFEEDGYFYRKNGLLANRQNFYFPDLASVNRNNSAVKKLLSEIGGGRSALSDDDIASRIESVFSFFRTKTKSSMGSNDQNVTAAANYLYRNCRKNESAPLDRWPSFQEIAETYEKYGFVPVGNCTANSQIAATLLYMSGVSPDRFFVAKFHYDMSWYVEHWVLAVNIGKRWYALDPQYNSVIRLKSAKDIEKASWEKYIQKTYNYKMPFEAYLLPGSHVKALPYLGDPAELRMLIEARNKPSFFLNNKKFRYSAGGMVFQSTGRAVVKNVSGNVVYLQVDAVSKQEGPRGMEEKKSSYELKITYNKGEYSTGEGYVHSGGVDSTGRVLNLYGEQSAITLTAE